MTPHEWDALAVVLSAAALVACVRLGWVWGRARLRADLVPDLERRLDDAYDEGWDDAEAEVRAVRDETVVLAAPVAYETAGVAVGAPVVHDWLTATREQLSPEHIQDPPGPARPSTTPDRAGGLRWWEEAPLPTVLGLGQEFSGDDRTFARWQVRRWEFRRQMGLGSIEAA